MGHMGFPVYESEEIVEVIPGRDSVHYGGTSKSHQGTSDASVSVPVPYCTFREG